MAYRIKPMVSQPCVWMSAGLLSYKLCDRDFDCEHCPLDAALRGAPQAMPIHGQASPESGRRVATFPDDRLYSNGHTWLQPVAERDGHFRFGLDGFATSLIGSPRQIRWRASSCQLHRGDTVCEIELERGLLPLGTPIEARLGKRNPALQDDPGAVVTAPYGEGWIVELVQAGEGHLQGLLTAESAKEQARLDHRRFRRRVALHLLASASAAGTTLADGGELLTDLRQILGAPLYLQLVRELLH